MAEREPKVPYYEQVATKLIEQLEAGTAPWQKPWAPGTINLPHNRSPGPATRARTRCGWRGRAGETRAG
jgi:antirestriction protein ArdC